MRVGTIAEDGEVYCKEHTPEDVADNDESIPLVSDDDWLNQVDPCIVCGVRIEMVD